MNRSKQFSMLSIFTHVVHIKVVDHYKSHITKVELERDDLKRELAKNMHKVRVSH